VHEAAGQRDAVSRAVARDKTRRRRWSSRAIMADVEEVEVVVAHHERATLRVGDVFLKIDADQTRTDVEVDAMAMAPIPTPEVLWRKPPVLALAALPGTALGRLGEPSTASPAAWAAAGAAARMLHDAPLPSWPSRSLDEFASHLDGECEWLVTNDVLPADLVTRNRQIAEAALRPWTPVFTHGDLQVTHRRPARRASRTRLPTAGRDPQPDTGTLRAREWTACGGHGRDLDRHSAGRSGPAGASRLFSCHYSPSWRCSGRPARPRVCRSGRLSGAICRYRRHKGRRRSRTGSGHPGCVPLRTARPMVSLQAPFRRNALGV
jgi:hypothetical protein